MKKQKIEISMSFGRHTWEKTNLITIYKDKQVYNTYQCSCGLKGKRHGLSDRIFIESGNFDFLQQCPNAEMIRTTSPKGVDRFIKIIHCFTSGPQFQNCTDGSVHKIISPPENWSIEAKTSGVCIMGISEPIRLLDNEFKNINNPE